MQALKKVTKKVQAVNFMNIIYNIETTQMIRARKKTTLRCSVFFWALTNSFISSSSGIVSMLISAVIFLGLLSPGFSMQIS